MIGLDGFCVFHRKLIRTYKQIGYYILPLECENKPRANIKKEVWKLKALFSREPHFGFKLNKLLLIILNIKIFGFLFS